MSVAEALAAIPEPGSVALYRYTPFWERGPGVAAGCVSGTAGPGDAPARHRDQLQVQLDVAHDLSWQGPRAYITLDRAYITLDGRGAIRWRISALGFIEQDAEQAFHAVCAAVMS